jgi:hypothetical protein
VCVIDTPAIFSRLKKLLHGLISYVIGDIKFTKLTCNINVSRVRLLYCFVILALDFLTSCMYSICLLLQPKNLEFGSRIISLIF